MSIYNDIRAGKLKKSDLKAYLRANSNVLREPDPIDGYVPLALAAVRGDKEAVQLLIKQGARGDTLSRNDEPPLLISARKTEVNRSRIIQLLLDVTPSELIDVAAADGKTALMLVLEKADIDSIRLLRKAGADIEVEDANGKTVRELAQESGNNAVVRALDRGKFADTIVNLILTILGWFNIASGVIKNWLGFSPKPDTKDFANINGGMDPTPAQFVENVGKYVNDNPVLKRFFKGKEDYLKEMAQKAADLSKSDPNAILVCKEVLPKTVTVTLHRQVIFCDDSGSMKKQGRWEAQKQLIDHITRITTRILPDKEGVGLHFINYNPDDKDTKDLTPDRLVAVLASLPAPTGNTPIGTSLIEKILTPRVYNKLDSKTFDRPLLVTVITDGMPSDEAKTCLKDAIIDCGKRLEKAGQPRSSVKFMIGQIGHAESATKFLNDLRNSPEIADMAYITTDKLDVELEKLRENERDLDQWLVNTLFTPVMNIETKKER